MPFRFDSMTRRVATFPPLAWSLLTRSLIAATALITFALMTTAPNSVCAEPPNNGWRGNGTGLWPAARVAIEWSVTPHGAVEGLRCAAQRSATETPVGAVPAAPLVKKGLLRDWLVLGPFPVKDSVQEFDRDAVADVTELRPTEGERPQGLINLGGPDVSRDEQALAWRTLQVPHDDPMVFGTAEMPWLDLAKLFPFQPNRFAYAHTYVYSSRGGPVRCVVDHAHGLKAWINGREVFRSPTRHTGLGFYTAISRHELGHLDQRSSTFQGDLKPGWNRLLLKISSSNRDDFREMRFSLRIMDPPNVTTESRNIRWRTELPGRSTSTPIIVGEQIFVMAEPDELICLDKNSGRILWTAANNYYEALTDDERRKIPALGERVAPLVERLRSEPDRAQRLALRRDIASALTEIDPQQFKPNLDGHFDAHFGIVGYTMPTPVSDGRRVFVWCGLGVAACYDLEGQRQWITRVPTGAITYGSSPALADGVLAVYLNRLFGLDAETGKLLWEQPRVRKNTASVLAARWSGESAFVSQQGEVIRPRDGKILFRPRGITTGDTGWSPPVILGDLMYLPRYGVSELNRFSFVKCQGEDWAPEEISKVRMSEDISRTADGKWIDRWTAGSPLIWQDLTYQVDIYGVLYVGDLQTGKMVYRRDLEIDGFMHYNAVPVAASPTLLGSHIFICDNQGTTVVIEPGREYREVARNRIATTLERFWPIPSQETLAYAPPVTDGTNLYLRGERYLYCIGH